MPLSKRQLDALVNLIRKRFIQFTVNTVGKEALTSDELKLLKNAGLLAKEAKSFVGDAHALGKITAMLKRDEAKKLTYKQVKELIRKRELPSAMTPVEKQAIEFAKVRAGILIRGIQDDIVRDATAMAVAGSNAALRAVQEGVSEAIAKRSTWRELKTQLFGAIDNKERDWYRVAHTEMSNAVQNGIYNELRDQSDEKEDQLCFKRVTPESCDNCRRVYLEKDGITPKIFRLKDLADTNAGLKAKDWQATIGPVHPWCNCQLVPLPDGFGLAKRRVAKEEFNFRGTTYKPGQIIEDSVFSTLNETNKAKVGVDAVLTHTGERAKPTFRKSEIRKAFSDSSEIDDCYCEF